MRIQHNIMAMSAYRNYTNNVSAMKKNLEKLSSGYKINRAGDDAAGLAISEKMRAQITGLETAQKNAKDGISLVQTAEGALTEVHDMLNRMVELATQSANGTYSDTVDREQLQKELNQLTQEIDRISKASNFNGINLLDGSLSAGGGGTSVAGIDRIISTVLGAGEDPVKNTGVKTILDGGNGGSKATKFDVDFTGLKTAAADATTNPNPPAGNKTTFTAANTLPTGLTITAGADTIAAGDVKMKYEAANADTGATVDGADDGALAGLTFTDADDQGTVGNGINIKFVYDSSETADKADWDQTSKTLTVTLKDQKEYAATDIEGLVQSAGDKSGAGGIDFSNFTVTGTGSVDTQAANDGDELGAVALAGAVDNGDVTVTVTDADGGTDTQSFTATDWAAGAVNLNVGGITGTFDSTTASAWDGTEATVGTAATANRAAGNNGRAAGDTKVSFKLGGTDLAADVDVPVDKAPTDIASAVFAALTDADTATDGTQVTINGAKWTVTDGGNGKLTFELVDAPNAKNIQGNFDWDVSITDGAFKGNHTAGTVVTQQGQVGAANATANTVFKMEAGDIVDGAKITIDGTTVTLAVGAKSAQDTTAAGVIDLTDMEAGSVDLNKALGKISEGFKAGTTNFIVGVNNKGNGDTQMGLTVHKKDGSTETYDTKEKLAGVFSIDVPGSGKPLTLQIGDTAADYNQLKVDIGACDSASLGLAGLSIANQTDAADAVNKIKDAINQVSDIRGGLGATQNRLDHTINNLSVMTENIQDAESTIRDVDVAEEMMAYTKNNILIQSAQAMLAQANQVPQGVLQLLQ